jgi:poly(A) polymerase
VAPSFLLSCMLWHDVLDRWNVAKAEGTPPFPALQQAIDAVFDARIGDISGRGKLAADMREIWMMQPRFERRSGSTPFSLIEQPRFRAGFDFLRLRADAGEIAGELADWWEDFSLGTPEEREALIVAARPAGGPRRAPRPAVATAREAGEAGGAGSGAGAGEGAEPADEGLPVPAAKKRRRRRRKPAGAGGAAGSGSGEEGGAPAATTDDA